MLGVVFVHGILSSPSMWDQFAQLIASDEELSRAVEPSPRFGYATGLMRLRPSQVIPSLSVAADSLKEYLVTEAGSFERLVLVGHSQGGLVIQRCLVHMLREGRGHELKRVRHVVLLATPNTGSQLLVGVRRTLLRANPQEKALRPYNEYLAEVRREVMRNVVYARDISDGSCPIPFSVYAGESDAVVTPASARDAFPHAAVLPGTHKTIARPGSLEHRTYRTVKRVLLAAAGPPSGARENDNPAGDGRRDPLGRDVQPGNSEIMDTRARSVENGHPTNTGQPAKRVSSSPTISSSMPKISRRLVRAFALVAVGLLASLLLVRLPHASGQPDPPPLASLIGRVAALAVSPDGTVLVAGGGDSSGQIMLWDISNPRSPIQLVPTPQSAGLSVINSLAFSRNGRTLAIGGDDKVSLWTLSDVRKPGALGAPINVGVGSVNAVAFDPTGRTLAIAGERGVQLWTVTDPSRPVPRPEPLSQNAGAALAAAFSPSGRTLAVASERGTVLLWDMTETDPVPLRTPSLPGVSDAIDTVAFNLDGDTLAFGGRGGSVGLLTVADPAHAREFVPDPDGYHATVPVVCLSFAPYSTTTLAIAGSPTGSILMWNWSEPNPENQVRNVLVGHTAIVESVVFAAGGRLLVSAGDDGTIRFWPMS